METQCQYYDRGVVVMFSVPAMFRLSETRLRMSQSDAKLGWCKCKCKCLCQHRHLHTVLTLHCCIVILNRYSPHIPHSGCHIFSGSCFVMGSVIGLLMLVLSPGYRMARCLHSADVSSATWVSHGWLATGVTEGGRTQHDSSVITPHTAPVITTSHRPAVI